MEKIKWGVIGCGGIADRRTIPGMLQADNAVLTAVMDSNTVLAQVVGEKYKVTEVCASIGELLQKDIDAVYIATPVFCHKEQATLAMRAGKHVLMEKPVGLSVEEAKELRKIALEEGVKLGVALMMRFHTHHQAIKELLDGGKLGEIVSIRTQFSCWYPDMEGSWRQKKALGGGGALIDLGVHCIDLLQYVTGLKASGVMALCDTQTFGYEVDDSVSLVMKMDNGAHAYVDANFNIPDDAAQSRLEIYGTKGSIIADGTLGQEEVGTTKVCLAGAADYNAMQNRGIVNSYLLEPASGNMYTKEHGGVAGSKGVEYHTFMFDVEKFCNDTMASDKYLVPVLKSEMVFQPVIGNQQLRTVFEKLVAIVTNDAACHPLQAEACIYEMLGILHQYSLTPTGQLTKIDKEFYQILEYINTHFVEKITAREISLQFNYNPSYFCRRFKAITGLSFVKYVQALRMEYAIKLLKEGKDEIRYIAWKCGYHDVSYFSNCFKNHFGFRPSEIYGQR